MCIDEYEDRKTVRDQERERCVKIAEEIKSKQVYGLWQECANAIISAIREGNSKP